MTTPLRVQAAITARQIRHSRRAPTVSASVLLGTFARRPQRRNPSRARCIPTAHLGPQPLRAALPARSATAPVSNPHLNAPTATTAIGAVVARRSRAMLACTRQMLLRTAHAPTRVSVVACMRRRTPQVPAQHRTATAWLARTPRRHPREARSCVSHALWALRAWTMA